MTKNENNNVLTIYIEYKRTFNSPNIRYCLNKLQLNQNQICSILIVNTF